MEYITFTFENETYWLELDEEKYALRQIILSEDGFAAISCRDDCLAEGMILTDEIDENIFTIDNDEFEKIWNIYSFPYLNVWNEEKKKYPVGSQVKGFIKYFYPQGIIMEIDKIQGVSDYDTCRKNSSPKNLYPGHKILGTVFGYDEKNMRLIISDSIAFE